MWCVSRWVQEWLDSLRSLKTLFNYSVTIYHSKPLNASGAEDDGLRWYVPGESEHQESVAENAGSWIYLLLAVVLIIYLFGGFFVFLSFAMIVEVLTPVPCFLCAFCSSSWSSQLRSPRSQRLSPTATSTSTPLFSDIHSDEEEQSVLLGQCPGHHGRRQRRS